jgi:tRNA dimethylallyltransferase
MKEEIQVVVILGPTAVGKSDLAVNIAKEIDGEIISADSRQVYKGLDIGTGKITEKEMLGIKHYVLDVADPNKRYSVIDFKNDAESAISEIVKKGKIPIITGGTGFYIQNLIDDISLPNVKPNEELRKQLEVKNNDELFEILSNLDSERVGTIDKNNKRKLIRAIEIASEIGEVPKINTLENISKYNALFIGLNLPSDELKKRIYKRLEKRINEGMIDEVINLNKNGLSFERMDELGLEYRYIAMYLKNILSLEEMKEKLKTEIWHYAKRQLTWFKRDKRINWFEPSDIIVIRNKIKDFINS